MTTVGEALIAGLEARGVDTVFGIPGVHTIELYRGLAGSRIRHVTPRHEQAAGFMADGYARVSGRPGVAFVITGPGLTNALTAIAQARGDSVPMLVVSGVNPVATQGRGLGHLHELPDQQATLASVALASLRIENPEDLEPALDHAFRLMTAGRPGPVHIEIPTDVMAAPARPLRVEDRPTAIDLTPTPDSSPQGGGGEAAARPSPLRGGVGGGGRDSPDSSLGARAAALLDASRRPVILAGGGARRAEESLRALAEALDAPVAATVNARGLMHRHPLLVPASPSLAAVRALLADADCVLALGTEFGPTDCDMYGVGGFPELRNLVRVDIDAAQLARGPAGLHVLADAGDAARALVDLIAPRRGDGAARAEAARAAALSGLPESYRAQIALLERIRETLPGAIVAGDSTQPVYAGNLFHDHDSAGCWFNSATGYGALGYALPAAIGAGLAAPGRPVVALTGDGGLQFCLAELGSARDAGVPLIVLVWNNSGYGEIEASMRAAGVEPVGVSPSPPDFLAVARAYGLHAERLAGPRDLAPALARARALAAPVLIDMPEERMLRENGEKSGRP